MMLTTGLRVQQSTPVQNGADRLQEQFHTVMQYFPQFVWEKSKNSFAKRKSFAIGLFPQKMA